LTNYIILQVIVSAFALFAISRSFLRYKAKNESTTELLIWTAIWAAVLTVVWMPGLTQILATIFGVGRGIDAVIYIAMVFLIYSIYRIYSKIERIEQEITSLTREMALKKK
jgi:small membrane protein